jgi:hypothetical protein
MSYRHSTRGAGKYREPKLVCNGQKYCGNGSCSVTEMMDFVADMLRQKIAEFEVEVEKGNNSADKLHEKLIKSLEKKLADIASKELSLWEAQLDTETKMPAHIFQALTDKLIKEREETETALTKARETIAAPINYEVKRLTFQQALDALLDDEVSVAEKNHLLKKCIEKIEYHRDPSIRPLGKGVGRQWISNPIELDIKLNVKPNA